MIYCHGEVYLAPDMNLENCILYVFKVPLLVGLLYDIAMEK